MKNLIVSSIAVIAAVSAIGLAAYSARGNQEAQISGGKLWAESTVNTEAKVEYSAPIERRNIDSVIIRNQKDYHKILNDETLRVRGLAVGFYYGGDYQTDLPKIEADSERFG